MHLKELTINGFKSFARKGELEFSTPITAIVGPNGSGKSNVAEAFRFVLGEQSIKSMRGKKGEDLIFNGSVSVSRANRASVLIKLDNTPKHGKRVFPLDFDEISIERVVLRDGVNEYAINGSKTRLKDVQELLAAANIGPTGHHIISQGEADRILSASARERREMIEDALGLKVYQFKKAESERKLKKTRENITQVEALRREVAPHLKFLERQIKKLERARELRDELSRVYIEYLKREDTYIAFHYDRLNALRAPLIERREMLGKKLEETKERLKTRARDVTSDALVALEKRMREVRERRQQAMRSIGNIEGQISFVERQIHEYDRAIEREDDTPIPREEFKKAFNSIERTALDALQGTDVKILAHALRGIVKSLSVLLSHSFEEREDTKREQLAREHTRLTTEKETIAESMTSMLHEEEGHTTTYEQLKKEIEAKSEVNRETEREVFAIMHEQREVEQKIDTAERELYVLERDRQDFKNELQEAVSLLGRGMGSYFEHEVLDGEGKPETPEGVVCEDRAVQINRKRTLERMKIRLEELGVGNTDEVFKEYKEVKDRDEFLVHEVADLTDSVAKLEQLIGELTKDLNDQFITGIQKIDAEFNRFFTLMFGGGTAQLLRVKPKVRTKHEDEVGDVSEEEREEDQEEGIELDVTLPNKKVRGLDMLSGGERALTSIALIFAMSQVNPPLFVILDETDAALDEANSRRYGDMISALAERSQLILITHNRETMSRAGVLYGVTMAGDGVSKLLSVKFDEAVAVAK